MKKKVNPFVICTGLVCLTAAELYALNLGYNGTLLKIFIAIVAGTIGYTIPFNIEMKGGSKNGRN